MRCLTRRRGRPWLQLENQRGSGRNVALASIHNFFEMRTKISDFYHSDVERKAAQGCSFWSKDAVHALQLLASTQIN